MMYKLTICLLIVLLIIGCEKERTEITSSCFRPLELDDWENSAPEDQGLDSVLLKEMYSTAASMDHLYSLLVVKDGFLVAERYFNGKNVHTALPIASVTKSFTSSLTGIALEEGYLESLDQTIDGFFPEINWDSLDPRKGKISIRNILQMRSGFPWEELSEYNELIWSRFGDWIPLMEEIPLASDPGTEYGYSNLMAHMLGIIISRATNTSLLDFAREHLCDPLEISIPMWWTDHDGYNYGHGDIHCKARDLAKFGLLYQNDGTYNGNRIIEPYWIHDALNPYSFNIYGRKIFDYFSDLDLGYMNWFSATAGDHLVYFSWGHGGQHIFLLQEYNLIIVTTANYMPGQDSPEDWEKQKAVTDMVGKYIASLPSLL